MFVGHYGTGFAAKAVKRPVPLWLLFVAVQLVDVFWAIFVLLGIERVRIVPGITATNPLDLYYMPYTHSLTGAMFWAIASGFLYWLFRKADGWRAAALVGGAVFSHWVLDLLVHRPDLPLYDNSFKVGLGLWDYPAVAFALEIAILFGGLGLYLKVTRPVVRAGRYLLVILAFVMVAIQAFVFFGPPPQSDKSAAVTALILYFVLAAVAYRLEKQRIPLGDRAA